MTDAVSAAQASSTIDRFAKCLAEQSWCIDVSSYRPQMLHSESNRTACLESIAFEFSDWEQKQGKTRLASKSEFMKGLPQEVAQRLPRVFGSSFRPTNERFFKSRGALMANTYVPYRPVEQPSPEGLALLNELATRLFPDERERRTVLQFLAHTIRHPELRPQFGLLIRGAGGTGKSLLLEVAAQALGGHHCWRENDFGAAFRQFSEVLPNNLVVTFDDAPTMARTYEQLKHAITSSHQEVEIKGAQRRTLREVYARIIVLSNDRQPFDLSEDRRFFVPDYCTHSVDKQESADFFKKLVPWLRSPECGPTAYHWLMSVDLSDFDLAAPWITNSHSSMSSSDGLSELVCAYVQDERLVHIHELSQFVARQGRRRPSAAEASTALKAAGYVPRRRSNPFGGGQLEIWVPAGRRRHRALNEDEVERLKQAGVHNQLQPMHC
jgi:hypothetical protein